jgi:hypothetical protein
MGPGELLFLLGVAVVMPIYITKLVLDYKRSKDGMVRPERAAEGTSLTTSELRGLIQEAVENATHELHGRLDRLERSLDSPRQIENRRLPEGGPLLDSPIERHHEEDLAARDRDRLA